MLIEAFLCTLLEDAKIQYNIKRLIKYRNERQIQVGEELSQIYEHR